MPIKTSNTHHFDMNYRAIIVALSLSIFVVVEGIAANPVDKSIGSVDSTNTSFSDKTKNTVEGIKYLGGKLLLDRYVEITGALKTDSFQELVGVSTPSYTLVSNHANLWLNNTAKAICVRYDNGASSCFATAAAASPGGSDTYVQYNKAGSFFGDSAFKWDYTNKLLTVTSPNSEGLNVLSGGSGNYATMAVGRTAAEARIAIAAGIHQFSVGAVAGDGVVRVDDSTKLLWLGAGGTSVVKISSDNVIAASSMTVSYTVTASSFSGNGVGLSALNASNITSGSLSDARLSSNVRLLASTQVVTAGETHTSSVTFSTSTRLSALTSTILATDSTGVIISTTISSSGINNQSTLQTGATFYVSSGTAINFNSSTATITTKLLAGNVNPDANQINNKASIEIVNDNDTRYLGYRQSTYGSSLTVQGQNVMHFYRANGTLASPTAVKNGDLLASFGFRGNDGTSAQESDSAIAFEEYVNQDWDGSNHGTRFELQLIPNGSTTRSTIIVASGTGASFPQGIVGVTDASNADAGDYGQYISTSAAATNAPASGTYGDLVSTSIPAGDWNINIGVYYLRNGSTWSAANAGLSTTSGNSATGLNRPDTETVHFWSSSASVPAADTLYIANIRVSISVATTYYLKMASTYTGGPPTAQGYMTARRIR